MRKLGSVMCAVALGLSLAACGGGAAAGSGSAAASSGNSTTSSTAATNSFVGTWKLACMEVDTGQTVVGDFSTMFETSGTPTLTISEDGTGSGFLTGQHRDEKFTWTASGDSALQLKLDGEADNLDWKLNLDDGMIYIDCKAGAGQDFSYQEYFTTDGSYPGYEYLPASQGKAVTSEDQVVGTWKMKAMTVDGITNYYKDEKSATSAGGGTTDEFVFQKDGTMTLLGLSKGTWELGAKGATMKEIVDDTSVASLEGTLLVADDLLLIDASEALGREAVYVLAKA